MPRQPKTYTGSAHVKHPGTNDLAMSTLLAVRKALNALNDAHTDQALTVELTISAAFGERTYDRSALLESVLVQEPSTPPSPIELRAQKLAGELYTLTSGFGKADEVTIILAV